MKDAAIDKSELASSKERVMRPVGSDYIKAKYFAPHKLPKKGITPVGMTPAREQTVHPLAIKKKEGEKENVRHANLQVNPKVPSIKSSASQEQHHTLRR